MRGVDPQWEVRVRRPVHAKWIPTLGLLHDLMRQKTLCFRYVSPFLVSGTWPSPQRVTHLGMTRLNLHKHVFPLGAQVSFPNPKVSQSFSRYQNEPVSIQHHSFAVSSLNSHSFPNNHSLHNLIDVFIRSTSQFKSLRQRCERCMPQ